MVFYTACSEVDPEALAMAGIHLCRWSLYGVKVEGEA